MSAKLQTISLQDGRKQSENGYFKLLVHFLHEHTIDDLQSIPDRAQFNHRFLSPHRIRRREHCSTFLRNIVQNNGSKKQLQIVTQLGILRSVIENAYRAEFCADSVEEPLRRLSFLLTRRVRLVSGSMCSSGGLDAFEQFGGLYVLLDLLFLDHRFRNLEPEFVTSTKVIMTLAARKRVFRFINQIILELNGVKILFLKREILLTLLADNYRYLDSDGSSIRKLIANSFRLLAEFKGVPFDFGPCGIVTSLTETAVASHTGNDHEQLSSSLEAIEPLVRRSSSCRADFLAVDGSIVMLIDLFGDPCEDPWYHPCGPYTDYVFIPLIFSLFMSISLPFLYIALPIITGSYQRLTDIPQISTCMTMIVVSTIILFILYPIYLSDDDYASRKCWRAGDVLVSIARDLHTNERALERFRQRDACRLMAQYINSEDHTRSRYFNAIEFLSGMISGHRRRQMGDIEVERRRLQELQVKRALKDGSFLRPSWKEDFNTILEFIQNYD